MTNAESAYHARWKNPKNAHSRKVLAATTATTFGRMTSATGVG